MAGERKFRVPHLPPIILWGTVAGLMTLGLLTTTIDLLGVPKAEVARANKQHQRFIVNATTGEVVLGDGAADKPVEVAPAPIPKPETPAEKPPEETPPPTPPATPEAAPQAAAIPATPAAPAPDAAAPAQPAASTPVTPAPAPAAGAAPQADALPKTTPTLRTEPLIDAIKDQPRTKDSLVSAPAPEITETVDGVSIPKRGEHDIIASKLYAHPFKRQDDQILISFVILNTGLDPQSIGLAMALPPEVTVAYSPYTKPGMAYSENVRTLGHEVWTMLPAMGEHYPSDDPGPMGIIGKMPPEETVRRVREVMGAIPGSVGLVLPPDETIIQQKETMAAALTEISARGLLLFATNPNHNIDQITTKPELAAIIRRADVVLDPTPNESQIRSRLAGLLDAAKDKGELVVALSSRPQSLSILNDWLQETKLEAPFVLAPLSAIYQPKEAPEAPAATASDSRADKSKPKPPPKRKPKVLPQDQYEPKANPAEKKIMGKFSYLPYRLGVGMMLLNEAGKVFVAKRLDQLAEAWQMPQGGIDDGEDEGTACMRELMEEIGTSDATILAESAEYYTYDLPDDLVPIIWKGKYRGQKQRWFALRLNGDDSLINITANEHPEFSEWKWVSMDELPNVIVPFKRALYEALVTEFRYLVV